MNIILAEERAGGQQMPEQSFTQGVILIGRDANECDIAFPNEQFPMVSRRHAELRWQDGKWFLIDLNSSYGTYIDRERVTSPRSVGYGNSIQFGVDGPVLRVVWFEMVSDSTPNIAQPIQPAARKPESNISNAVPESAQSPALHRHPAASAQLDFVDGCGRPPLKLGKPTSWIGRELDCDVIFDASSATVSRRHAQIRIENADYLLIDNNSFNGTLLNDQRIASPVPLYHGDEIQLGLGGPVLKFNSPTRIAPHGSSLAGQRVAGHQSANVNSVSKTMVVNFGKEHPKHDSGVSNQPQLLMSVGFGTKNELRIGRDETNDIRLDGLQISKNHARLIRSGSEISADDLGSTNGVFVNGARVSRQTIGPEDSVQIGSFVIRVDVSFTVNVYDTRSKTRIDALNLTREVRARFGGSKVKLLDDISLSIQPNEFVGLLGPSGAGKSTLIEALNGVRPANIGIVRINNLDLYRHIDSLKQAIGYVPQDDIIHRELTVYRTLYYVAKLRLSRDVSSTEIARIIDEVLDVTGLADRKNAPINQLSGGERKRVSIAVELVTKPSVIFLDEPTSGLDPSTEDKIMRLFRQIAESGRTVIMTTHAMENVKLFDKIVVLMRGRLVFFGKPDDALNYLKASNFKELYDRLDESVDIISPASGGVQAAEQQAEHWKKNFLQTPQYRELIEKPLKQTDFQPQGGRARKRRLGILGSLRQWVTLSLRYLEVLLKDKLNLFILFAQAPIIALLTFFVMGANRPRDFVYFVIALVAVWFGASVSAREIIRERAVYQRERMFNLGILPYLASKLFVLGLIVFLQCVMLFLPLKFFDLVGLMPMPGELGGVPQFWAMLLTAGVGIALGLLVSALVKTSEMATSLIPLILIPQILFSGIAGVPGGVSKVVGMTMPAAWSFDTMKRFSTLETLEPEGAHPRDRTKGQGLYRFIEKENEATIEKAKSDLEDYKRITGGQFQDGTTTNTNLTERLSVPEMQKIPVNLSGYVTFLHPWMNEVVNQLVLMFMFGILVIITLIVLRLKDIK